MPCFAAPLPVQCCEDDKNLVPRDTEHVGPCETHESEIFNLKYLWSVVRYRRMLVIVTNADPEIYGDPEVHPQHED